MLITLASYDVGPGHISNARQTRSWKRAWSQQIVIINWGATTAFIQEILQQDWVRLLPWQWVCRVCEKNTDVLWYPKSAGCKHRIQRCLNTLLCFWMSQASGGLDSNQIVQIREIIRRIGKEKTIIISTHILSEEEATCQNTLTLLATLVAYPLTSRRSLPILSSWTRVFPFV